MTDVGGVPEIVGARFGDVGHHDRERRATAPYACPSLTPITMLL